MDPESDGAAPTRLAIGTEIGSRGLRAVLGSERGDVLDSVHAIQPGVNAQAATDTLFTLIDQLLGRYDGDTSAIRTIGIAFGGPVDVNRGTIIYSPRTPGFENYPLAGLVEERFGIPSFVENDARCAAIGEYRFGAGRGAHSLVYVQLGIGVGGGIVINGELQHGIAMTAGEFGHMQVSHSGPRCSCGKRGHLEAYVSEPSILARFRESGGAAGRVDVGAIFNGLDAPESPAGIVASEAVQMIGLAIANLVTALGFDTVVIGGYANGLGPAFVAAVRARVRQYALDSAVRRITLTTGQLGAEATLIGTVALGIDRAAAAREVIV